MLIFPIDPTARSEPLEQFGALGVFVSSRRVHGGDNGRNKTGLIRSLQELPLSLVCGSRLFLDT